MNLLTVINGSIMMGHPIEVLGFNMAKCLHSTLRESCAICGEPPFGINKTVYYTLKGLVFHNDRECPLMRSGQSAALTIGLRNHKIESCAYGRIRERGACDWCCALYNAINQQSQQPCYIKVGPNWIEAFLLSSRVIAVRNGYKVYEHMVTLEMKKAFPINNKMLKMSKPINLD